MSDLMVIEGTSEALRRLFVVHEDARVCFIDEEPGDWGYNDERYLASHDCGGEEDYDYVIELWAHPDTDPAHPWFAYWTLHQALTCLGTPVTFCPHCGLNLNQLYVDPFAGLTS